MSETIPRPPTPRPSRETTRERLLDGAYQAFCEVGFQGATIEDVCSRAGFTRGAFYSNFSSLDELLLALWERQNTTLVDALRGTVAEGHKGDAPFERAMTDLIALRASDRDWFVIGTEFLLHALRTPDLQRRLAAQRAGFRDALRGGIEILLAAQGRRPPDGIDIDMFTQLLIAGHVGCRHVNATEPDDGELIKAMLTALLAACPPLEHLVDSGPPES